MAFTGWSMHVSHIALYATVDLITATGSSTANTGTTIFHQLLGVDYQEHFVTVIFVRSTDVDHRSIDSVPFFWVL